MSTATPPAPDDAPAAEAEAAPTGPKHHAARPAPPDAPAAPKPGESLTPGYDYLAKRAADQRAAAAPPAEAPAKS